eukprot:TRINITY_DN7268_c0_g1_i1.p1 TRINITY_DN7268_c0_g1~~TRINITY_DN7268_c0_g1_i1.p1  ORF type:complete len:303 (-),score=50.73 TRINITY_DN7268_c0_g1_i1:498-1406(-)
MAVFSGCRLAAALAAASLPAVLGSVTPAPTSAPTVAPEALSLGPSFSDEVIPGSENWFQESENWYKDADGNWQPVNPENWYKDADGNWHPVHQIRYVDHADDCFPAEAQVQLRRSAGGILEAAPLWTLQGSEPLVVHMPGGSDVAVEHLLGFSHLHEVTAPGAFLAVEHVGGVFRATGKHMVVALVVDNGGGLAERRSVATASLQAGDKLLFEGATSDVLSVRGDTTSLGLSAPVTAAGTLIVDGSVASCYAGLSSAPLPHSGAHAGFFFVRFFKKLMLLTSPFSRASSIGLLSRAFAARFS